MSEKPAADGPHYKPDCKQNSGVQLLYNRIITREERVGKVQCERGIGVKVVPLDKISGGSDEDRFQALAYIGEPELINCSRNLTHVVHTIVKPRRWIEFALNRTTGDGTL